MPEPVEPAAPPCGGETQADGYLMEPVTYRNLQAVMRRLYEAGHRPLSGDDIRDLANIMNVNLDHSHVFPVTEKDKS